MTEIKVIPIVLTMLAALLSVACGVCAAEVPAGKRIERLVLESGRVVAEESLLLERCQRMRTVNQGPDGALYVLTDEDAGQLLRIVPKRSR